MKIFLKNLSKLRTIENVVYTIEINVSIFIVLRTLRYLYRYVFFNIIHQHCAYEISANFHLKQTRFKHIIQFSFTNGHFVTRCELIRMQRL